MQVVFNAGGRWYSMQVVFNVQVEFNAGGN